MRGYPMVIARVVMMMAEVTVRTMVGMRGG